MIPPEWSKMSQSLEFANRFSRANRRMTPGSFGGRTESASPPKPVAIVSPTSLDRPGAGKEYATLVVASAGSTAHGRAGADYVCDGVADEVEINAACAALGGAQGRVVLLEGEYFLAGAVNMPTGPGELVGLGITSYLVASGLAEGVTFPASSSGRLADVSVIGGAIGVRLNGSGVMMERVRVGAQTATSVHVTAEDARLLSNRVLSAAGGTYGIRLLGPWALVSNNKIGSNAAGYPVGLAIEDTYECAVQANQFLGNVTGVQLIGNADDNSIQINMVRRRGVGGGYGIDVSAATCNNNFVTNNDLRDSGTLGSFRDLGTGTVTAAGNRL